MASETSGDERERETVSTFVLLPHTFGLSFFINLKLRRVIKDRLLYQQKNVSDILNGSVSVFPNN